MAGEKSPSPAKKPLDPAEVSDPDVSGKDVSDFKFRLEDPLAMLPADKLFSDCKLVLLRVSMIHPLASWWTLKAG